MALESATYINQLVSSNPAVGDPVGQGDDHIRLIKSTLLATFPNFTGAALASTNAQIDAAVAGSAVAANVPTGLVSPFAGSSIPAGYLLCNGQSVSTTTYAALYVVIGTTYGSGSGTFAVPDLRGRTVAGVDSSSNRLTGTSLAGGALAATGGAPTVTLGTTNLPAHSHTATVTDPGHTHASSLTDPGHSHAITDPGHVHTMNGNTSVYANNYVCSSGNNGVVAATNNATTGISINSASTGITHTNVSATTGITVSNANTGSGTAFSNLPPVMLLNWIIKT